MRRQNAFPRHIRIAQKPVGRARLAPVIARLRDTGRRFGRKSFYQVLHPSAEAGVAKIQPRKFPLRPLQCGSSPSARPNYESQRDPAKVYKRNFQVIECKRLIKARCGRAEINPPKLSVSSVPELNQIKKHLRREANVARPPPYWRLKRRQ